MRGIFLFPICTKKGIQFLSSGNIVPRILSLWCVFVQYWIYRSHRYARQYAHECDVIFEDAKRRDEESRHLLSH